MTSLLTDPLTRGDGRTASILRTLAFHHAYHGIIRGLLHRANNHLQGVRYGVPFLTGEDTVDPPPPDRLRELVGDGAAGTLEAIEQLSTLVATRHRNQGPAVPGEIARRAIAWAAYHNAAAGTSIALEADESAPAIAASFADAACTLALVLNNAIEQAAATGGPVVRLTLAHSGNEVTFVVQDDGPGLTPEQRASLFDVGYSDKDGHEGLGLPFAAWLAAGHRGTVTLRPDAAGGGFQIAFPAAGSTRSAL